MGEFGKSPKIFSLLAEWVPEAISGFCPPALKAGTQYPPVLLRAERDKPALLTRSWAPPGPRTGLPRGSSDPIPAS